MYLCVLACLRVNFYTDKRESCANLCTWKFRGKRNERAEESLNFVEDRQIVYRQDRKRKINRDGGNHRRKYYFADSRTNYFCAP